MHLLQQGFDQLLISVFGAGQAQPAAHQVQVVGLIQRQKQPKGFAQGFNADKRRQCLGQRAEVPLTDRYLVAEGVAAFVIGMVTDELGVKVIEEGERAKVEGNAQNRHVVGVHHPVAKAVGLPLGDQCGVALDNFAEHGQVRLGLLQALGEVQRQHMLAQQLLLLGALGVVEVFEMAETHMAGRQA